MSDVGRQQDEMSLILSTESPSHPLGDTATDEEMEQFFCDTLSSVCCGPLIDNLHPDSIYQAEGCDGVQREPVPASSRWGAE